jgi:hypothetical protein
MVSSKKLTLTSLVSTLANSKLHTIFSQEMFPGFDRIWNHCIQEETQLVSKQDMDGVVKRINEEN